jgi:hypothetical protein
MGLWSYFQFKTHDDSKNHVSVESYYWFKGLSLETISKLAYYQKLLSTSFSRRAQTTSPDVLM